MLYYIKTASFLIRINMIIVFIISLYGCAANLEYTIDKSNSHNLLYSYEIIGSKTEEKDRISRSVAEILLNPQSDIFLKDRNNFFLDRFNKSYNFENALSLKLLNNIKSLEFYDRYVLEYLVHGYSGTKTSTGTVTTESRNVPSTSWQSTGPISGVWTTSSVSVPWSTKSSGGTPEVLARIFHLYISDDAYKISSIHKTFYRKGYFFNIFRTNSDQIYLSEIIKSNNVHGYLDYESKARYFTFWNSLHYLLPTGAVLTTFYLKYNKEPDTLPYAIGISVLSWFAIRFLLNFILPHDIYYDLDIKLAKISK